MKKVKVIYEKEIPENFREWLTIFLKNHKGEIIFHFDTISERGNFVDNVEMYKNELLYSNLLRELSLLPIKDFKARSYKNEGWDSVRCNWDVSIELNIKTKYCLRCGEEIHFRCHENKPIKLNINK